MPRYWIHQIVVFGVLFAFWVVLSGRIEPRYLVFGLLCALGITALSSGFLYSEEGSEMEKPKRWLTMLPWHRLFIYIPWLAVEIVKANLVMIPMILGPRSRLQPRMFTFKTKTELEIARAVLGNSITMTPGTLTVDLNAEGEYLIHAVDQSSEDGVMSRSMERRVAWAFGDQSSADDRENITGAPEQSSTREADR